MERITIQQKYNAVKCIRACHGSEEMCACCVDVCARGKLLLS